MKMLRKLQMQANEVKYTFDDLLVAACVGAALVMMLVYSVFTA
jgi:hypothetical protein